MGHSPSLQGSFPKNEYTEASGGPSQDFPSGCSNRKEFGGPWHRRTKALFFQPTGQECTGKQKEGMWRVKATSVLGRRVSWHPRPENLWTTPCYHELPPPLVSLFLNPPCEQHRSLLHISPLVPVSKSLGSHCLPLFPPHNSSLAWYKLSTSFTWE